MTDKRLFTPGPLTTSLKVKEAMLHDLGSRDESFIKLIRDIRNKLLKLGNTSQEEGFEAILMQGSGTFGLESTIGSIVPPNGSLLVIVNGAYGERVAKLAEVLKIDTLVLRFPENEVPDPGIVKSTLSDNPKITTVSLVHCETTTGILNPIEQIGRLVHDHGASFMLDAMSSFGAIEVDLEKAHVDFLVTSANKCLEGVPGFSIILARRSALVATKGFARSMSLDLFSQWDGLERNGQFRFTPPTHTLLAQGQALAELEEEGGVAGRAARYAANHKRVKDGLVALGFIPYLQPERQSFIITSFLYPDHPNFDFEEFYSRLGSKSLVIYPGKLTQASCFRIGNIGRLFEADMDDLLVAIESTLKEMEISMPTPTLSVE